MNNFNPTIEALNYAMQRFVDDRDHLDNQDLLDAYLKENLKEAYREIEIALHKVERANDLITGKKRRIRDLSKDEMIAFAHSLCECERMPDYEMSEINGVFESADRVNVSRHEALDLYNARNFHWHDWDTSIFGPKPEDRK